MSYYDAGDRPHKAEGMTIMTNAGMRAPSLTPSQWKRDAKGTKMRTCPLKPTATEILETTAGQLVPAVPAAVCIEGRH